MNTLDTLRLAGSSLHSRPLRSWLTILGIVIGVASIATLLSLAYGINAQITNRLSNLEGNAIQVTPGGLQARGVTPFGPTRGGGFEPPGTQLRAAFFGRPEGQLSFADAQQLVRIPGVARVDARVQARAQSVFRSKNASISVVGVDPEAFREMTSANLTAGRFLSRNDRFAVVLGFRVYNTTFQGLDLLNRQLTIQGKPFRVVGLLSESSGFLVTQDNAVYIPQQTAKALFNASAASAYLLQVNPDFDTADVSSAVEQRLRELRRVTPERQDFTVTTASFILNAIGDVTGVLALFLGGVAAISLLVGGIAVANTMFTSVLERTKEIGVLKALGASDADVLRLFVLEAALIGLVGGLLGVLLAYGATSALQGFGVPARLTFELLLFSPAFAILIGVLSGFAPARNAAGMPPVEALRYE